MLYGYTIQDIERNLSSAGFWERRKMQKEIAEQEKKRSDFHRKTVKEYGTESQLKLQKDKSHQTKPFSLRLFHLS